jgi:AraC-like DNA-binding protein
LHSRPEHPHHDGALAPERLWIEAAQIAPLLLADARGEDERRAVCRELGLNGADGDGLVPLLDYFRLTRAHAVASREESLGLAPRPLVSGTTDFVMAQATLGETLGEAMANIARAYNQLHVGEYNFVEVNERACVFRVDDAAFPYTRPADVSVTLMLECVLIYLHSAFSAIAGQDLTGAIRSVSTRRSERSLHDPLAFWRCPITYGAPCYAVEYTADAAHLGVARQRLTEAAVHNRIVSLIEQREAEIAPAFAPLVRKALRDGARDQDEAARRVGVSVPTLRRKLMAEGLCFRTLRQAHLNEEAKLSLLKSERIADVADALGFSDPRSFTRAFKAWNGLTPRSFRSAGKSVR